MPAPFDRCPTLGPKRRIASHEDALAIVRAAWPDACQEGSTGAERTWFVGRSPERMLVAHHWSPSNGADGRPWWIRIAATEADAVPYDDRSG